VADLTGSTIASIITKGYKALVSTLNVNRFRKALIMFFVMCNIAFHVIELFYYKELLLAYSADALKLFLVLTGNTLKRWILEEFEKKKLEVKNKSITARSRIYISFNL
jgi:membrane protease YdiL (CAAX protease family)